jgi:hypothetical protein
MCGLDLCESQLVSNNQLLHKSYKVARRKINYKNKQGLKLMVKNATLSNIIFHNEIKVLSNMSGYIKQEYSLIVILKALTGKVETKGISPIGG